jgi:hypothetical protein
MRDLAFEFDRIICHLGLELIPAFGMLLGLTRADRMIPWTSDDDYWATKETLGALYELWNEASHLNRGLALFYGHYDRLCITDRFAGGRLAKNWKSNKTYAGNYDDHFPYADIFLWRVRTLCSYEMKASDKQQGEGMLTFFLFRISLCRQSKMGTL